MLTPSLLLSKSPGPVSNRMLLNRLY